MKLSGLTSSRASLWLMIFTGFALNYAIRITINIAIVDMVYPRGSSQRTNGSSSQQSACLVKLVENGTDEGFLTTTREPSIAIVDDEGSDFEYLESKSTSTKFDWDEREQNLVLGAFFWSMWITQLPGGLLAQRYGTKLVFGLSQLVSALLAFLVPLSGTWGFYGIFILRFFQGLANGFTWPAMNPIIGKWVPPEQRSKFLSAYMGSSFGAALIFPGCAMLIAWWGWESVFYATGILGVIWFIIWWLVVFDSPAEHPRISERERNFIEKALAKTVAANDVKLKTPWRAILTSGPVWFCLANQFCYIWGLFTMLAQAPTYFKFIHGFGIHMTGLLSGIPHLTRSIVSLGYSVFADFLLERKLLSVTAVRNLSTFFGSIVSGACLLGLGFVGCDSTSAVILLTVATGLGGATSSGSLATTVDLSPNFSGAVFGFVSLFSVLPGFLSPILVGFLTYENQTTHQWQLVFISSAAIVFIGAFLFMAFGTSETQSWNYPPEQRGEDPREKRTLNGTGNDLNENEISSSKL